MTSATGLTPPGCCAWNAPMAMSESCEYRTGLQHRARAFLNSAVLLSYRAFEILLAFFKQGEGNRAVVITPGYKECRWSCNEQITQEYKELHLLS